MIAYLLDQHLLTFSKRKSKGTILMTESPLLAAFKAALDAETNPESPLSTIDPDSIDEFLARIDADFAEGHFDLEPARLLRLVSAFQVQAANWEMEQQAEKTRTPRAKKATPKQVFDTSDIVF